MKNHPGEPKSVDMLALIQWNWFVAEPSATAASSYPAGNDKVAGFELSYGMIGVANKIVETASKLKIMYRIFIKCGATPNEKS